MFIAAIVPLSITSPVFGCLAFTSACEYICSAGPMVSANVYGPVFMIWPEEQLPAIAVAPPTKAAATANTAVTASTTCFSITTSRIECSHDIGLGQHQLAGSASTISLS